MKSVKLLDFLPPPPCPHLELIYTTKFTQPPIPCPLFHDPLGHHIWKPLKAPPRSARTRPHISGTVRRERGVDKWRGGGAVTCRQLKDPAFPLCLAEEKLEENLEEEGEKFDRKLRSSKNPRGNLNCRKRELFDGGGGGKWAEVAATISQLATSSPKGRGAGNIYGRLLLEGVSLIPKRAPDTPNKDAAADAGSGRRDVLWGPAWQCGTLWVCAFRNGLGSRDAPCVVIGYS